LFAKTIEVVLVRLSSFLWRAYTRTNFPCSKAGLSSIGTRLLGREKCTYARANLIYQRKIAHLSGALVRGENYSMLRVAGTIFSTHARFWIFICRRKIIKPFSLRKISFPSNLIFLQYKILYIYIYVNQAKY
jgi:hypothetical protein